MFADTLRSQSVGQTLAHRARFDPAYKDGHGNRKRAHCCVLPTRIDPATISPPANLRLRRGKN
jgi:hypothetical protein